MGARLFPESLDLRPKPVTPDFHGLLSWTFDPACATNLNATQPTSGTRYLHKLPWKVGGRISGLLYYVGTAGATLTAGQNLLGVVGSDGTLLGQTADQSAIWTGTGLMATALASPVVVPADPLDFLWVMLLAVGTTTPKFAGISATGSAGLMNAGLAADRSRVGTNGTLQTALGSITPSSNGQTGVPVFFGVY